MTNRSTWKKYERRIARLFGTERTPLSGENSRHTGSDTLHPDLYVEIKKWDSDLLLKEYREAWKKAEEKAEEEEKTPVYVFGKKYKKDLNSLVVLRLKDFLRLTGGKEE